MDEPHAPAPAGVVDDALTFLDTYLPGMRDSFNGRSWLDSWVDDAPVPDLRTVRPAGSARRGRRPGAAVAGLRRTG